MVSEQLHALFDAFQDAYLRERSTDLDDVLGRIQLNLAGAADAPCLSRLPGRFVLVAGRPQPVGGGGPRLGAGGGDRHRRRAPRPTTRRSSRARSASPRWSASRTPRGASPRARLVVVDGTRGRVVVEPSGPALAGLREVQERDQREEQRLQGTRALPAVTLDGVAVALRANVEFIEEVATASLYGAQGIGLFRSEYLLGRGRRWPSEEQQVDVYRRLLEQMAPHPVTVRTWDVGLDEMAPGGPTSPNPALGRPGASAAPALPGALPDPGTRPPARRAPRTAADDVPLRLAALRTCASPSTSSRRRRPSSAREGCAFADDVPVGLTIEVPSAALTADLLAREVDFFSIGTNDLIQYLLAVDRADPRVAALYQPLHPAVAPHHRQVACAARRADARSPSAGRWPPIRSTPCCSSASACASSPWLPPRSPGSRPRCARSALSSGHGPSPRRAWSCGARPRSRRACAADAGRRALSRRRSRPRRD